MNAKVITTLIFIMLPLLWAGCAKETIEPEFFGAIEGQVQNSAGAGIPSVSITTSPGTDAILTDQEGQFLIEDIETGNYSVQARKDGFITQSTRIAVKEDRTTNAQIVMLPDESEGSSNGNINAAVDNMYNVLYNSRSGTADSNFVDVEYSVENLSSSTRVGNYEVYFEIFTPGDTFKQEISGDSLAIEERTFGTFTRYIRQFQADSVVVSGIYAPDAG
jgi:hypothetical protein